MVILGLISNHDSFVIFSRRGGGLAIRSWMQVNLELIHGAG